MKLGRGSAGVGMGRGGGHIRINAKEAVRVFLGTATGRRKVIRLRLPLKNHGEGKQNGS